MHRPTHRHPGPPTIHRMQIAPGADSEALRFPQPEKEWLGREVTHQDWATFTSHLILPRVAERNSQVAEKQGRNRLKKA
jgi:hypothetical protein